MPSSDSSGKQRSANSKYEEGVNALFARLVIDKKKWREKMDILKSLLEEFGPVLK